MDTIVVLGKQTQKDIKKIPKGDRKGQRSSSLSRSWRVIYKLDQETQQLVVEVLEVNHHEYKK